MLKNRIIKTARPYFRNKKQILASLDEILSSGRLMMGKYTLLFEREFCKYNAAAHAVSLNSCTSALEIVLRYINVKGSEVILPTNTFIATPNSVLYAGAKPVFADVEVDTFCLDPVDLRKRITRKTKAVIAVHVAGLISPSIDEITRICRSKGLILIEDCAHAHGAMRNGRKAGTFGLAGCFSFYPTKIMTTGSGGMLTTDDKKLEAFAHSLRLHGAGKNLANIVNYGNDWFLDEFRSAVGFFQLKELENLLQARRKIVDEYIRLLRGNTDFQVYQPEKGTRHAYYKFPVLLGKKIPIERLKKYIFRRYGIELESVYNPPCHLQPVYKGYGNFPVAEDVLRRQVTLPVHPLLAKEDVRYVVRAINDSLKKI